MITRMSSTRATLLLLLAVMSTLGAWVNDALAIPSITGPFNFRDNVGPRPDVGPVGDLLLVGATDVTPAGPGTTVQAVQGGEVINVPPRTSTIQPNVYTAILAFDPLLTGSWTLTAKDGTGTSLQVTTNAIPNPEVIPLVGNLQASGALLTPHLNWALPGLTGLGVTRISVRVRDLDQITVGGVSDTIFGSAFFSPTTTSFDIPSGVLVLGEHYAFEVLLDNIVTPATGAPFLQNRSETFSGAYSTPEPPTPLLLVAGLSGLAGALRRRHRRSACCASGHSVEVGMIGRRLRAVTWFTTLGLILVGMLTAAAAGPITFDFAGSVTSVVPALSGTFSPGDTFSGSYTFESTTPDADPSPGGFYAGAIIGLTFTIGPYTGTLGLCSSGPCDIFVQDNGFGPCASVDCYFLNVIPSGPSVAGVIPTSFQIGLNDFTGLAFSSDALPLTPPDLSLFLPFFGVNFDSFAFGVEGSITSFTLASPVPEPSTLLLLAAGIAGLTAYGWRRGSK